jgi:pimeloyl-ACP methyl ester carboxylesterase
MTTPDRPTNRERTIVTCGPVDIDLIAEGRGRPIVLLPSRARGSDDLDDVADRLAKAGFRVLRPQPRGTGHSRGPTTDVGMHDLARDVAEVIGREAAGPAVIVGHAFGSWVARMLATDHPELVRGIVLAAAASRNYPPGLREVVRAAGDTTQSRATRLAALRKGFFAPGHDPTPWLDGWWAEAEKIQSAATARTLASVYWGAGTAPLLDLVAQHDPFKPEKSWYESREDFGERATVTLIADASHALLPEQPDAVVAAIVSWIERLPA